MNKVPGPSDTNLTVWVTCFLERAYENSKVVFVIDPQHVSKQNGNRAVGVAVLAVSETRKLQLLGSGISYWLFPLTILDHVYLASVSTKTSHI